MPDPDLAANPVVDPGEGPGPAPPPPLLLDQTEARRAEKIVFWDAPPPLSNGLDDWDPPYLKVWD